MEVDVNTPGSLEMMCKKTKLVLNCVGPVSIDSVTFFFLRRALVVLPVTEIAHVRL